MRLKQIKLAGFKSFVDPTVVVLPGNRAAVVGPNGCGKSNIIDAVRWVMGESSARQLRGESLTDVIFNGSNSRPPTSLATVELTFDNSDVRIGGEFAQYAEISIRREVTRESQSTYYLNGQKCRRRDIQDVFLGTGFGPRSYSIIEQGMISQLVEAKPDELRGYLEEAAGISKYRERRRETENRIGHTVENLERLTDLRGELDRQLAQLERSAAAAEKYTALKHEERVKRAELTLLGLDEAAQAVRAQDEIVRTAEVEVEAGNAEQSKIDARLETERQARVDTNEAFNEVQGRFYRLGAEIARLEESIASGRARLDQLRTDLDLVRGRFRETEAQQQADVENIERLDAELENKQPALARAELANQTASEAFVEQEARLEAYRDRRIEWQRRESAIEAERRVLEDRVGHIDALLETLERRGEQLAAEVVDSSDETDAIAAVRATIDGATDALGRVEAAVESNDTLINSTRRDIEEQESVVEESRLEVQFLRRDLAALEALQQVALGRQQSNAKDWLDQVGLFDAPRLGEGLAVVPGWEHAVETIVGQSLQAVRVDNVDAYADTLGDFDEGEVILFEGRAVSSDAASLEDSSSAADVLPMLAEFVRSENGRIDSMLIGVFAAESLDVALEKRTRLKPGQSIVTRDGIRLGFDWLSVDRRVDESRGVIQRGQEIDLLQGRLEESEDLLDAAQRATVALRARLDAALGERESLLARAGVERERLSAARSEHEALVAQSRARATAVEKAHQERSEIDQRLESESARRSESVARVSTLEEQRARLASDGRALDAEGETIQAVALTVRREADEARETMQQLRLERQAGETARTAARSALERLEVQREGYVAQIETLERTIVTTDEPLPGLNQTLAEKLADRIQLEHELGETRRAVEEIDQRIRSAETERASSEQKQEALRGVLETARVEARGLAVEKGTIAERFGEIGLVEDDVRAGMPDDADKERWTAELDRLGRRIERLGRINLAAIDELESQKERKEYLDSQQEDLEQALATLRTAIGRIDRETRTRFKATFDEVNGHLTKLFPKVFGGGHAHLELTGEDMLDAGVTLMAQPPGKRNTNIHLLSGGEKAMTAVALVFSIFQLNPSPVCLLDEVDAPLDDANVVRFAGLIEEMSSDVQFVVITHNKLTMEMADHLMGVTMHEPGVSRMVSVDVEEAVRLAAV